MLDKKRDFCEVPVLQKRLGGSGPTARRLEGGGLADGFLMGSGPAVQEPWRGSCPADGALGGTFLQKGPLECSGSVYGPLGVGGLAQGSLGGVAAFAR